MSTVSNRDFLRQETRQAHQEAEAAWPSVADLRDREAYMAWLATLHEVHVALVGPAVRVSGDAELMALEKTRLAALQQDLGACVGRAKQPLVPKANMRGQSWAWGVHYAISGSALGAKAILAAAEREGGAPVAYLRKMRTFATEGGLKMFFDALNEATIVRAEARQGAEDVFCHIRDQGCRGLLTCDVDP